MVYIPLILIILSVLHESLGEFKIPDTSGFFFAETFQNSPEKNGRLIFSKDLKYENQPLAVKPVPIPSLEDDKVLTLMHANQYYGAVLPFSSPLKVEAGQDFVLQYEVMLSEGLTCGGAYLKVLRQKKNFKPEELNNDSPYVVMFGPDKCGSTDKVHFILQHQNPISKKWEEKHFTKNPSIKSDNKPHLYTLLVTNDNKVQIYIDKDKHVEGSLLEDMSPAINPPKEVDDPTDIKPEDWVDEMSIIDVNAKKPDDWDDDAPRMIPDEEAVMPRTWLEDEPEYIPDPSAQKPEDWNDEEDGIWEAPVVPNPKCEYAAGCGEWVRPDVPNPLYKGKWKPATIPNPAYKGEWKPRQIPNPHFFEDEHPAQMAAMGAIAVEVWTTSPGIVMDNIIVSNSLKKAFSFAEETWRPKQKATDKDIKKKIKEQKKAEKEKKLSEGGLKNRFQVILDEVYDFARENPLPIAVGLVVVVMSAVIFCFSGGPKPLPSDDEDATVDEPQPQETVTSVQGEKTEGLDEAGAGDKQGNEEDKKEGDENSKSADEGEEGGNDESESSLRRRAKRAD